MHLFKSQLLQEVVRPDAGPHRDRGFGPRYARRRARRAHDDNSIAVGTIAASNDDFDTIDAEREILRRMADYDQAA